MRSSASNVRSGAPPASFKNTCRSSRRASARHTVSVVPAAATWLHSTAVACAHAAAKTRPSSHLTRAVRIRKGSGFAPTGQLTGLLHPTSELRLVERFVFMNVEVANVLLLG